MKSLLFNMGLLFTILFLVGCAPKSISTIKPKKVPVTRAEIDTLNKEIESITNEADNVIDDIAGTENRSKIVKNSALLDKCARILVQIAVYNQLAKSIGDEVITDEEIDIIVDYCNKNIYTQGT